MKVWKVLNPETVGRAEAVPKLALVGTDIPMEALEDDFVVTDDDFPPDAPLADRDALERWKESAQEWR